MHGPLREKGKRADPRLLDFPRPPFDSLHVSVNDPINRSEGRTLQSLSLHVHLYKKRLSSLLSALEAPILDSAP